jgi:hypothetical protein
MLTDKKIKLIQEFRAQMNELQTSVQRGEVPGNSKVSGASRAMLLGGVNEEDIMAFSRQFPETPVGISMPGPDSRINCDARPDPRNSSQRSGRHNRQTYPRA